MLPLTEHALQPHEAADVTVKVDVESFISVAHGYDVIELLVEVETCMWTGQDRGQVIGAEQDSKLELRPEQNPTLYSDENVELLKSLSVLSLI